jgi:hypothetical protein
MVHQLAETLMRPQTAVRSQVVSVILGCKMQESEAYRLLGCGQQVIMAGAVGLSLAEQPSKVAERGVTSFE